MMEVPAIALWKVRGCAAKKDISAVVIIDTADIIGITIDTTGNFQITVN
jgi:hypothetical protein